MKFDYGKTISAFQLQCFFKKISKLVVCNWRASNGSILYSFAPEKWKLFLAYSVLILGRRLYVLSAGNNFWKDRWLYFLNMVWLGNKLVFCWHCSLTAGYFCWPSFYSQWFRLSCETNPACLIGFLWCRAGGYRSMLTLVNHTLLYSLRCFHFQFSSKFRKKTESRGCLFVALVKKRIQG